MTEGDAGPVQRYTAFSHDPRGGNRAGMVLAAQGWSERDMQRLAAEVGYSETAFVVGESERGIAVRYFSPAAEVPFCGHATIALAVALAEQRGTGERFLQTQSGAVPVTTRRTANGLLEATLTTVTPRISAVDAADLAEALALLGWSPADLQRDLSPRVAYAGASHLVLVADRADRLAVHPLDREPLQPPCADEGGQLLHRRAGLLNVARGNRDIGPRLRQAVGDAQTDAAIAAGDDGDLAVQIEQLHRQAW